MPFELVREYVSHDTTEALAQLLIGARDGDVIGLAFVALLKHRRFIEDVTGRCVREATITRGALAALDDHLSALVHARLTDETR